MTSNAKWGVNTPVTPQPEDPFAGLDEPFWRDESHIRARTAPRDHDPDARALLNRHLAALQGGARKQGNSALHDLENKLAELCETTAREYAGQSLAKASYEAAPADASYAAAKSPNLTDRLKELSSYLNEDLAKLAPGGAAAETGPDADRFSALGNEGRTRNAHKTVNAPILDRAWFEDRFAAMRSSIDEIARNSPDERIEKLGDQFSQLMEKLDLLQAGRSQAAVESGLKKLAAYLEENKHWTVSHDNRLKEVEDRLDHLSRLVAQSNAALSATAKGLELVARGTGPALATRTADLVAERLEARLSSLDSSEKVAQLGTEVGKLSQQSQHFARKTDERLKTLQGSLDEGLNRMEQIGRAETGPREDQGWDSYIAEGDDEDGVQGKLAAARRAARLTSESLHDLPEDGEPIRHRIPYGEFLPAEERGASHGGLILAAVILLLASAAMLYLNLKESGAAKLFSGAETGQISTPQTNASAQVQPARPVRIMLNQARQAPADAGASLLPASLKDNGGGHTLRLAGTEPEDTENLRKAAIAGDVGAQHAIAESYLRAVQGEAPAAAAERLSKAARWFRRAAESGHAASQYRLATLYELGHGVPQSYPDALAWYERAALGGHVKAMHNLAVLTIGAGASNPDYGKAAFWFSKAAERGLKDSQYNLAILYEHGVGVEKNSRSALRWYSAAALQGDEKAARKRDLVMRSMPALQRTAPLPQEHPSKWAAVTMNVAVDAAGLPNPYDSSERRRAAMTGTPRARSAEIGWNTQITQFDETVAAAQKMLLKLGFALGDADGILGPRTLAAIRAFQQNAGLAGTGEVSPSLISKLKFALSS